MVYSQKIAVCFDQPIHGSWFRVLSNSKLIGKKLTKLDELCKNADVRELSSYFSIDQRLLASTELTGDEIAKDWPEDWFSTIDGLKSVKELATLVQKKMKRDSWQTAIIASLDQVEQMLVAASQEKASFHFVYVTASEALRFANAS